MKTCYNCGNNANPSTLGGKRNVVRLKREAFEHYHPLSHFGFCVKRRQWLGDARIECSNWMDPCRFDASHVHLHLPHRINVLANALHRHRYAVSMTGFSAAMLGLLAIQAFVIN